MENKQMGLVQAANYCKMGRSTFRNWVKEKKVKYTVIENAKNNKVFTKADLDEFIEYRKSIMSLVEIEKEYNVTNAVLRMSISAGYLPAKRYLKLNYCKRTDVEKWLQKREKGLLRTRTHKAETVPVPVPVQSIEQVSKPTLEELITRLTTVLEGLL